MIRYLIILVIFTFFYPNCNILAMDNDCFQVKDSVKKITQEFKYEIGYIKNNRLFYTDRGGHPEIYKWDGNNLLSNINDTCYIFISDYTRAFNSYQCDSFRTINYYSEFLSLIQKNSNKIDSIFVKVKKRGFIKCKFLYLKFKATIYYFEDYKKVMDPFNDGHYYYDFISRNKKNIIIKRMYPVRFIIDIYILSK